ncbi:MAG: hypothetical protein AAGC73_02525 [Verrucomicrobiota bacterium]
MNTYHVNFTLNEAERTKAMDNIQLRYGEEPHASLMRMVSDLRVASSEDLKARIDNA